MRVFKAFIIFLLFSSVGVVLFQIVSLKAGYEVDLLQKRLDILVKERQELLLRLGELISTERIKRYVKSNGFIFCDKNKVVYLDIKKDATLIKAQVSNSM